MITPEQSTYIEAHAYVPEHLPAYVTVISPTEPFLVDDFVVYVGQDRLIFIGYSLDEQSDQDEMTKALDQATARFKPTVISVTAPVVLASLTDWVQSSSDFYYRLDLSTLSVPQKVRNMLRRANREISVAQSKRWNKEHKRLVDDFLRSHRLPEATQYIFKQIPEYVKSNTAWLFEARNSRDELVAFDVAEFGARHYAFYMFNFISRQRYVPGASDLLLSKVIEQAKTEDKRYINLGLGINPGVTFFKTKWGGIPFLPYTACLHERTRTTVWEDLFDSLL